jgi:hypothetical protein
MAAAPEVGASASVAFAANTTLTGDLFAHNVTIDTGVTLTTNGYAIVVTGTFDNYGTVLAGFAPSGGTRSSYGGSGGGAESYNYGAYAQNGSRTHAPGGIRNTSYVPLSSNASAGSGGTPAPPPLTRTLLRHWFFSSVDHLAGASGGAISGQIAAGQGSYGVYLQARTLVAGVINTEGQNGGGTCSGIGLSGGGGGGAIVLAVGPGGLTTGTYVDAGGSAAPSCAGNAWSGSGGAGQVAVFAYLYHPPV